MKHELYIEKRAFDRIHLSSFMKTKVPREVIIIRKIDSKSAERENTANLYTELSLKLGMSYQNDLY